MNSKIHDRTIHDRMFRDMVWDRVENLDNTFIVVFEGIDNIGKTTAAKRVIEMLNSSIEREDMKFSYLKYPNEQSYYGKVLREILQGKRPFEPVSFQALNILDRVFSPIKDRVIVDRYTVSGEIYGKADGIPEKIVEQMNSLLQQPDMVFVFTGEPFATDNELYDNNSKIAVAYEEYLKVNAENTAVVRIDANREKEVVAQDIYDHIKSFVLAKNKKRRCKTEL